jgi:hypothetical protein
MEELEETIAKNSRVKHNKGKHKEIGPRDADESRRFDFYPDWSEDLKRFVNESIIDDWNSPSSSGSKPFVNDKLPGKGSVDARLRNQTEASCDQGGEQCNLTVTY